jgi:hypothetical protein
MVDAANNEAIGTVDQLSSDAARLARRDRGSTSDASVACHRDSGGSRIGLPARNLQPPAHVAMEQLTRCRAGSLERVVLT